MDNLSVGYIGLGKMGLPMASRLTNKGYRVVGYARSKQAVEDFEKNGGIGAHSITELSSALPEPRLFWLMVPHTVVSDVIEELLPHTREGDIIIDGGNSPYKDSIERAKKLKEERISFLDVGVSGGPEGAKMGACLMVGGERDLYRKLEPLIATLSAPQAYGYMGSSGAGHFVKMIHNGIEYGMMQALAEGFTLLRESPFDLSLSEIARVYNEKSVIESRLTGWLLEAISKEGKDLQGVSGEVGHSGEGQWSVETAEALGVPVPVIKAALQFRIDSKNNPSYTGKIVSALRNQFGGHSVHR